MGKKLGVVIGRFQIDRLHNGHLTLLEDVYQRNNGNLLILVGDRDTPPTATNPLSFEMRKLMLEDEYPDAIILALPDHPSNAEWSKNLDTLLTIFKEGQKYDIVTLYTGRNGFKPHYSGKFPVEELSFSFDDENATARRKEIADDPIDAVDHGLGGDMSNFRAGIIYAMQHLPHRIYLTVDIAITSGENGEMKILMAQRAWETDVWRLPGGFVEKDESFKAAARRECEEETSAWLEGVEIVGDYPINDWRLRDATNVTHRTVLCHGQHWGNVKANDDIARVHWIPMNNLLTGIVKVVPEHESMFFNGLVPFLKAKGLL